MVPGETSCSFVGYLNVVILQRGEPPVSSVMSEYRPTEVDGEANSLPQPMSSTWPFVVLLAVNSLSLFATLATLCSFRWGFNVWVYAYIYPAAWAVMEAQLYLVAFWFSFGTLPKRRRRLLLLALIVCGGACFGAGVYLILGTQISFTSNNDAFAKSIILIAGTPLLAVALVWMANAMFVIPAWFINKEVGFRSSHTGLGHHQRTFGIRQLFSWTTQVALPLGLFNAYIVLTGSNAGVIANFTAFVIVIICCSPLVAAMLLQRISIAYVGAALVWAAMISFVVSFLPEGYFQIHPFWSFGVHTLTVFLNVLALRRIGLRWHPKFERLGRTDG
jgi:hypothetical protein